MGTWATPFTDEDVSRLEALMAEPLPASRAADVLYDLVGDDTLFDAIVSAVEHDPDGDVRPLVAITLDEWTNWMHPESFARAAKASPAIRVVPFDDGCWERLKTIAGGYEGVDLASIVGAPLVPDTIEGAKATFSALWTDERDVPELEVAKTRVPGVYAVRVADGEISRVEILYGVIAGADPRLADELAASLFPAEIPAPTVGR
ncbi:hypothetical protein [Methylobacterium brachiatum]